jgi:hypothetical protein
MVVHPCNPSYSGDIIGRTAFQRLASARKHETLSEKEPKQKKKRAV